MLRNKLVALLGALMVMSLVLSACGAPEAEIVVQTVVVTEQVVETVIETVEVTREVMVTPPPAEVGPKTLVVCMGQEPDNLYLNGGSMAAAGQVQQALYDGPIDNRTYSYQPIIIEKLPNLEDGDAVINAVTVQAGDMVLDDTGEMVELADGLMVRPSGCRSSDCAIAFAGDPLEMDQMVVTFKMKAGLTWADGEPVTADDSVYNFELISDPDTAVTKYLIDRTLSYEAADDRTIVWTARPGYIDSTYFINFYTPQPRHLWQEELGYKAADLVEAEESSRLPMGYGPFVIKEWVAGDHITVEKNPHYYRASEGLPYIDTVIYRFINDPNAAVAQLLSGECDIVTQETALEDQAELLLKLEEQGVIKPVFVTGTVWEHVDFGINPTPTYDRPDFFEDVRTRRAIAHCIDRQAVVDTILYGRSIVIDTYIPPEHPLFATGLTHYDYDPAAAMALLEEVGWVDTNGDGVREAQGVEGIADGTLLQFKWQSTTAPMRVQYMQIFQQNLAECGIKVNLENLSAAEFFADGPEGPLFGNHYDLGSFAWLTGVEPSCDLYLGSRIPSEENGWGGQNNTGLINSEYDAACLRAITALPGSENYIEGHKEAQRLFADNLPVIPLFLRIKIAAIRPEVTGFFMDPTQNSELWNIEAFDLNY
jgi:peptide/nickel transport system substrate-binding protein